jgi:hypothetical protein
MRGLLAQPWCGFIAPEKHRRACRVKNVQAAVRPAAGPGRSSDAQGVGNVKFKVFGPALVIVMICSSDVRPSKDATTA